MKKLKVGIIGCGGIANSKHLPALTSQKDKCEIVAFCDIIRERAEKAAAQYGVEGAQVCEDYHDLLANPEIDVVHVLTPNVAHCPITVAAFEAGKHVMCEKPMAATTADAQLMMDAWKKSGKKFTIGYQNRFRKDTQTLFKACRSGDLGDIYFAKAHAIRRRAVPTWGVFPDKSKQGGGPLIDIGTHALDLTLFMMNNYDVDYVVGTSFEKLGQLLDPEHQGQINSRGEQDNWNNKTYDVEDSAIGHIKMKNGAVINLRASWAMNMLPESGCNDKAHVMLAGTKGGLDTLDDQVRLNHIVAGQPAVTMVGNKVASYIPGFSQGPAPVSKEHEIWVKALRGEGELFVTADQAFVVTKILDAIYQSSKTGKPVYF